MIRYVVTDRKCIGMRLDLFLARALADRFRAGGWSRSGIQRIIAEGQVALNGQQTKPSARLKLHDRLEVHWQPARASALTPEALPLDILYEDEDCLILNKAAGMVVHPAAGRGGGTVVNALLAHCPALPGTGGERRPGIVHRLDKDTSGVMVVAKHDQAFQHIALQFKERRILKEYLAFVWGLVHPEKGVINRPIGRHRSDRKKMSSRYALRRRREAATEWQVEEPFFLGGFGGRELWVTLLRLRPHSGRTHQIRVHLLDQGFPVVGDRLYGRPRALRDVEGLLPPALAHFPRQALHAARLGFTHPRTGAALEFNAPLPADMRGLLEVLREKGSAGSWRKAGKGG
jgi:23S rRNA pseudouridine1911/1915/1917 synthase